MSPALIAPLAALVGGVLWLVHAALGDSGPLADTLYALGLACVIVAAAVFGSSLVKSDATGLRVVVGVASGLLALSVVQAFRPDDAVLYDAFWGAVTVLLGSVALLRARGRNEARPAHRH